MAGVGVRAARRADVDAVVDVQVRAWREGYGRIIPEAALTEMTGQAALAVWRERWTAAVVDPPSPQHRLLVALDGAEVTGLAAHAPADDPDQDPAATAELLTLLVDPRHARRGHGTRLLAATVDHVRDDGMSTLVSWVFDADSAIRALLEPAGWAPDGATRTLDLADPVAMIRLHTDITDP